MSYRIRRPPAHLPTFVMPPKEVLDRSRPGSVVKVMLENAGGEGGERMPTEILTVDDQGYIKAQLRNQPVDSTLPLVGQVIRFHVTDIIDIAPPER